MTTFNKAELLSRFNIVRPAISSNSTFNAFKMLRIDVLGGVYQLIASDGLMQITAKGKCEGEASFSQCVDPKMFSVMLSAAKGDINIVLDDNKIKTVSGKSKFNIPSSSGDTFPCLTLDGEYNSLNLKEIIDTTYKAIPVKHTQPAFMGVGLDQRSGVLNAVATDSNMILINSVKNDGDDFQIIIPKDSAEYLANIDTDGFCVSDKSLKAYSKQDDFEIITKLIDAKMIDWRRVISDCSASITTDRNELLDSVMTIAKIENAQRLDIESSQSEMTISMKDGNGGMISNQIECIGDDVVWSLDPKKLAVCLGYIDADEIVIGINTMGALQSKNGSKQFALAMMKR